MPDLHLDELGHEQGWHRRHARRAFRRRFGRASGPRSAVARPNGSYRETEGTPRTAGMGAKLTTELAVSRGSASGTQRRKAGLAAAALQGGPNTSCSAARKRPGRPRVAEFRGFGGLPVRVILNHRSIEQCARLNPECFRKFLDNRNSRISSASFKVADVGAMDVGLEGEPFLRPALFEPKATQISAKSPANVHAGTRRRASTIGLQTISDN